MQLSKMKRTSNETKMFQVVETPGISNPEDKRFLPRKGR